MNYVLSLLVENHEGVLSRISGLISGRGYNVESFTAGATTDPSLTRITLVCRAEPAVIEQIKKQLNKLIEVIKLVDLTDRYTVDRELALIKISAKSGRRGEIFQIADAFNAQVMDVGRHSMVLELTGSPSKIDDMISLLDDNIIEMARSGLVSLERGKKVKEEGDKTNE
ncbi:MAG: acetolactate synthase small subunit [Spirochaetales bacterium]|nr:acetolactate synthase small subunit [Spirochaetales bacterium]